MDMRIRAHGTPNGPSALPPSQGQPAATQERGQQWLALRESVRLTRSPPAAKLVGNVGFCRAHCYRRWTLESPQD